MNTPWQDFLQQHGAVMQGNIVQHFGRPLEELIATQSSTVLCDLGQFGTLKISGADAQSFLQNLLSSDVSAVNALRAQLSSLNSPKGRMIASLLIWQSGADYYLQLPRNLCAAIQKKLAMYVLRAKVKVEEVSTQIVSLGLAGEHAAALLNQHVGAMPTENFAVLQHMYGSVICLGERRFQINILAEFAADVWQKLSGDSTGRALSRITGEGWGEGNAVAANMSKATSTKKNLVKKVGAPCWDWLQIRAGLPVIVPATQEQFVAQMVNFELLGGVNFKKGCYPGQEIVARMQYLGKLKRRMYLANVDGANIAPQAGDELYSVDMEGQSCGMIVNAAPAPNGGYDVLAVVQISSQESQGVHWKSLQGAALKFIPLPYALEK